MARDPTSSAKPSDALVVFGASGDLTFALSCCMLSNYFGLPAGSVPVTTVAPGEGVRTAACDFWDPISP